MNNMITIRIYLENGAKAVGLTRWQRLWDNSLANQLMKLCKAEDIQQVICFNVTSGYLNWQKIEWGTSEVLSPKHPQCIEISDSSEKITSLLEQLKPILGTAHVYKVEITELTALNY